MMDISPPVEPHTPDAERRQLTVMFCDLVHSTAHADSLLALAESALPESCPWTVEQVLVDDFWPDAG